MRREEDHALVDLHLHSRASGTATNWWVRGLGAEVEARESYTPPGEAYRMAKRAGMDFVTLTDHETIEGALTLPRPPHPPPRQPGPPRARRRRARQDGSSRFPRRPGCSSRGAAAGGRGPEAGDPHGPGRAGKGRKAVLLGEHRPRSPCSVRCLIPDRPAACSVG
jgi:hypothetical protein